MIDLPALRDRKRDIPLLAESILKQAAQKLGKPALGFSPQAMTRLVAHNWPGNVRELQNVVQQMLVAARGSGLLDVDLLSKGFGEFDARPENTAAAVLPFTRDHARHIARSH